MHSAPVVGGNLQRPGFRLEDVLADEPVQGGGRTVSPGRLAASRRRLAVATISDSPEQRAAARCRASLVRMKMEFEQ